ncbi:hypothetical protein H7R52_00195 [Weissella confusa]|uniref:Uncharacterized protein n=1 Tax=Weissella confusa TaxID=1583 RepID=A0A923NFH0_WEICO|nr:hypothetical protein [Weissella confusa]
MNKSCWGIFDTMMTYKAIVAPVVEIWFADDYTDEAVGVLFRQHDGDFQQEMEMPYSGDHSWLGKGLIVEIRSTSFRPSRHVIYSFMLAHCPSVVYY